jgi:competence protein ComGF
MIEILIFALCAIGVYITLEMIKYNKQLKEDERNNNEGTPSINQERYNLKHSTEVPKAKVQSKRKPGRPKKKNVESKKVKKDARRDKRKV